MLHVLYVLYLSINYLRTVLDILSFDLHKLIAT